MALPHKDRVVCRWAAPFAKRLTRGKRYAVLDLDGDRLMIRVEDDRAHRVWYPAECFAGDLLSEIITSVDYEEPPEDDAEFATALVTRFDGTRWLAAFVTYAGVARLHARSQQAGDRVRFYWQPGMVLVDALTRDRVEHAIQTILEIGAFEVAFVRCESVTIREVGEPEDGAGDDELREEGRS